MPPSPTPPATATERAAQVEKVLTCKVCGAQGTQACGLPRCGLPQFPMPAAIRRDASDVEQGEAGEVARLREENNLLRGQIVEAAWQLTRNENGGYTGTILDTCDNWKRQGFPHVRGALDHIAELCRIQIAERIPGAEMLTKPPQPDAWDAEIAEAVKVLANAPDLLRNHASKADIERVAVAINTAYAILTQHTTPPSVRGDARAALAPAARAGEG